MTLYTHAAPIQRLPSEVLAMVFTQVRLPEDIFSNPAPRTQAKSLSLIPLLPLPLSHVCRAWRDAVISDPLLWTDIYVTRPWKTEIASVFFERSRSCLMNLHVWMHYRDDEPLQEDYNFGYRKNVEAFFGLLMNHIQRCRSITIRNETFSLVLLAAFRKYLQQSPTMSLPHLQKLHLEERPTSHFSDVPPKFIFPLSTPALTHFGIASSIKLPLQVYSQLLVLHIEIAFFSWDYFCDIINNLQLLDTLAVYDDLNGEAWESPGRTISLPSLSTLHLYNIVELTIPNCITFISAPKLTTLIISPFLPEELRMGPPLDTPGLKFPTIKTLVLFLGDYWDGYVSYAIRFAVHWFPCIEEAVVLGEGTPAFVEWALQDIKAHKERMWPHLHTLGIRRPLGPPQLSALCEVANHSICRLYVDKMTLNAQPELSQLNKDHNLEVIERDMWGELRRDGLYLSNSFDFEALKFDPHIQR